VATPRRSCWHPWYLGPRPHMCLKVTF
jgi:hypothetical protein